MRRLLLTAVATAAAVTLALPLSASADPVDYVQGPPTANWIGIYNCRARGGVNVAAGKPFTVRLSGWISGTAGLVRAFIPKDASTATIERPLGTTPANLPYRWQAPTLQPDGSWGVLRWPQAVFTLGSGQQMRVVLTVRLIEPARDLVPPSSTWDPASVDLDPWDGTGLKYDGGVVQPFTDVVACIVTGV